MTELNGKPAIKITCKKVIWGNTDKAKLYEIEGDQKWVPISVSSFERKLPVSNVGDIDGVLTVQEWYYNKNLIK